MESAKSQINEKVLRLNGRTLAVIDWANVYGWFSDPKSKNYLGWRVDPQKLFEYLSSYREIVDKRLYFGVEEGMQWSEDVQTQMRAIGFNLQSKEVKWVPVSLERSHFKKVVKELFDVLDGIKTTNSNIATRLYELKEKIGSRLDAKEPNFDVGDDGQPYVAGGYPSYTKEDGLIYMDAYDLIENLDDELKKLNLNIDELQKNLSTPVMRRKCDFDVEIARDVLNLSNTFDLLLLFSGDGDYAALAEDLISKGKKVIVVFAPGHVGKEYEKLTERLIKKAQKYRLFLCSVNKLLNDISPVINIPADFSAGRDVGTIADPDTKSQTAVDKV